MIKWCNSKPTGESVVSVEIEDSMILGCKCEGDYLSIEFKDPKQQHNSEVGLWLSTEYGTIVYWFEINGEIFTKYRCRYETELFMQKVNDCKVNGVLNRVEHD